MTASNSIHSNAFNFLSHVRAATDPRTGQFTCTLDLPPLKANKLCGPDIPLLLRFSPLNTTDSGYGLGWDLQLSQYNPVNQILALSTGETFKVTGSGPQPAIREKKIDSFHFFNEGFGTYRVVHKSGLVEILREGGGDRVALPIQILSAQGHGVDLRYENHGNSRRLAAIDNADGSPLLRLEQPQARDKLFIRLHPESLDEALYTLQMSNERWVTRVELPTEELAAWRFDYDLQAGGGLRIKRVETPVGAVETITYTLVPHYFPGVAGRTLARVDTHHNDPGFGQPPIVTRYFYPPNHHNFLGYNSSVVWRDDGLDNLYRAAETYLYSVTESLWDVGSNTAIRSIDRTYNRFHLMTLEETVQNDNVLRNDVRYHLQPGIDFDNQPAYCQLPNTANRTWYSKSNPAHKRTETVISSFDDFGNLLVQVHATGEIETNSWYSAEGELDTDGSVLCPKDPQGFVRNLKSKTLTPAPSPYGAAPQLSTRLRYSEQRGLSGHGPWLAIGEETLQEVGNPQPLQVTQLTYIDKPDDLFEHGRRLSEALTLNGKTTTTGYQYSQARHARRGEPVQQTRTTLTGFDGNQRIMTSQHSLQTAQAFLEHDDGGVTISTEYDLLGRETRSTTAADSDYAASRSYRYFMVSALGQQAEQRSIDVLGVETHTLLDGLGRVIHEELIGSDADDPQRVVRTYSARYDNRGLLSQETKYDWWEHDGRVEERALTTRYRYDDWNQKHRVTESNGVVSVTQNDPITLEQRNWLESSDTPPRLSSLTLTSTNLFEKPVKVLQLDAEHRPVSEEEFFYDGLGNCVKQYDPMGQPTLFEYDARSRLSTTTLPDGVLIARLYAEHSADALVASLTLSPHGHLAQTVLAGEQTFDGLGRRTRLKVGPRIQDFEYQGSNQQASKQITGKGREIAYEYQLALTEQPTAILTEDEHTRFTFDRQSAQLKRSQNDQGEYEFERDKSGRLRAERWIEAGITLRETLYTSTPLGLPLSRSELDGLDTTFTYDLQGRIACLRQGQLQTTFSYDSLGQLQTTRSEDLHAGSLLLTEWQYDDQGRECLRTQTLTGYPPQTVRQTYRPDSKLATRHLHEGDRPLLLETFTYDPRGRLEEHLCSGELLPRDRYGNAIVKQIFAFDALDNITHAWTTFADGSTNEAFSEYAADDPCQLVKISHSHLDYLREFPLGIHLHYDADGHLQADEHGHLLEYDIQGRLLAVKHPTGATISHYRYDSHDQLVGVRHGSDSETLRFYQDDRLSNTRQDGTSIHYFHGGNQPVGQQTVGDDDATLLFLTDAKRSVLAESQGSSLRRAVYDAYGNCHSDQPLRSELGYNGELREQRHGWYLLGQGYRAYNPHLCRFHSPDSFSPFGPGGINPYLYVLSDPINHTDPTGHAALKQYAYESTKSDIDPLQIAMLGVMIVFAAVSIAGLPAAIAGATAAGATMATKGVAALTVVSTAADTASVVTAVPAMAIENNALQKFSTWSGWGGLISAPTGAAVIGKKAWKSVGRSVKNNQPIRPLISDDTFIPPQQLPRPRSSGGKSKAPVPPPKPIQAKAQVHAVDIPPPTRRTSPGPSDLASSGLSEEQLLQQKWTYHDDDGNALLYRDAPTYVKEKGGLSGDLSLRSKKIRNAAAAYELERQIT